MFASTILKNPPLKLSSGRTARLFYDSRTKNDTIFAPSTHIASPGGSPLGVIRVSGSKTCQVCEQMTRRTPLRIRSTKDLIKKKTIQPREATLTRFLAPETDELIDIGLTLWFPGPHSYTGEDVSEFHLHGSQAIMRSILTNLGKISGLRPAEPGEFTRRAVLNKKLTLMQAESLLDLISSNTESQRRLALKGLGGSTRLKYESWIQALIRILAHLEASIDFGEDELIGEVSVVNKCLLDIRKLSEEIASFIEVSSRCRNYVRSGFKIAILGKPNVGKSTFMNVLCKQDKSIVADLSGTTRDVIEHSFELGGHALTICDTAGLRDLPDDAPSQTLLQLHDLVEREGIRRALEAAKGADLVLYLIDGSNLKGHDTDLNDIIEELSNVSRVLGVGSKPRVINLVINKIDLCESAINMNGMVSKLRSALIANSIMGTSIDISLISCATLENINSLVSQITSNLKSLISNAQSTKIDLKESKIESSNSDYVNERHLSLLTSTQKHLQQASEMDMSTIDHLAQHVRESVGYLSLIVGSVTNDRVIDIIFRDFCIGK